MNLFEILLSSSTLSATIRLSAPIHLLQWAVFLGIKQKFLI